MLRFGMVAFRRGMDTLRITRANYANRGYFMSSSTFN